MSELNYGYQLHKSFVIIMPTPGGPSVYIQLEKILAELKPKIPCFARKHIICEGHDGYWDLVLPTGKGGLRKPQIYPLNALTLGEAQVKILELIASGKI